MQVVQWPDGAVQPAEQERDGIRCDTQEGRRYLLAPAGQIESLLSGPKPGVTWDEAWDFKYVGLGPRIAEGGAGPK